MNANRCRCAIYFLMQYSIVHHSHIVPNTDNGQKQSGVRKKCIKMPSKLTFHFIKSFFVVNMRKQSAILWHCRRHNRLTMSFMVDKMNGKFALSEKVFFLFFASLLSELFSQFFYGFTVFVQPPLNHHHRFDLYIHRMLNYLITVHQLNATKKNIGKQVLMSWLLFFFEYLSLCVILPIVEIDCNLHFARCFFSVLSIFHKYGTFFFFSQTLNERNCNFDLKCTFFIIIIHSKSPKDKAAQLKKETYNDIHRAFDA